MENTIKVSAASFVDALSMAVAEKKTTIATLTHVLIEPFGNRLRVISTDLDKTVITELPCIASGNLERFLVPHRKTMDLLKGEDGEVTITGRAIADEPVQVDGEPKDDAEPKAPTFTYSVTLAVSGCEYELGSLNPAHFPETPEIPKTEFKLGGDVLRAMLGRTTFAISREESRYTLNGALMEIQLGRCRIVASDGHRLAMDSCEIEWSGAGKRVVIPADVFAWTQKRLPKTNVYVTLGEDNSSFIFDKLRTVIVFRNLKGQFPNYEAVLPRPDSLTTTVDFAGPENLVKSLTKVAKCADERTNCIAFRVNGCFEISAQSDGNKALATVPAVISHGEKPELSIGFCSGYVLEFLKAAGNVPLTMAFADSRSAGLFKSPELPGFAYILMPMRV